MNTVISDLKLTSETDVKAKQSLNILFLDDQEVDRMRLMRLCKKAGLKFQAYEASNLAEFSDMLSLDSMDLVFLDYYLDMDTGADALKLLISHEDQSGAIPIMVTSVDRHDVAVALMRNGCADYLTKEELSVDSIRKTVSSAFERRILIAAIAQSHTSRAEIRRSMRRMSETFGPEMRSLLTGTLRHIRDLRSAQALTPNADQNLTALEQSVVDIHEFLDEVDTILQERALPSQDERDDYQMRA